MSKVDEKAALRFVAFQANLASMCFAFGALLFSVGRGLENGHGGIGLSFDSYADLTCPNNTVVVASNGTNGTVVYNTVNLGDPSLTDCGFQYRFDDSRLGRSSPQIKTICFGPPGHRIIAHCPPPL
jgi:hypothetical protein